MTLTITITQTNGDEIKIEIPQPDSSVPAYEKMDATLKRETDPRTEDTLDRVAASVRHLDG